MKENEIRALLEGAYAQTATLPGYWLKFDDLRSKFNELVSTRLAATGSDETISFETALKDYYPDAKIEEAYQLLDSDEVITAIRIAPNKLTLIRNLKKKLERAINTIRPLNDDGWKPFASIGLRVEKDEILAMGFVGYRHAVESIFGRRYEFRAGDTSKHEAPVQIRDLKTPAEVESEEKDFEKQARSTKTPDGVASNPKQGSYIGEIIDKYAYFPRPKGSYGKGWDIAINDLAVNKALDEYWWYDEEDKLTKPILKNYISYTFERLRYEDEQERIKAKDEGRKPQLKILENEKYAIWNTGLVNNVYDPIYAFFERNDGRNPSIKQPWIFVDFNTANSFRQRIIAEFPYKPARASYFDDPRELFYDTTAEPPTLDFDHFLIDNIERIPIGFLKKNYGDLFSFEEHPEKLPRAQREAYFNRLASAIYADEDWKQFVVFRFKQAVNVALSRVSWNYKTAIPVYYINDKKMQLLLPLALEDKNRIDVALVCEHKYRPEDGVNNYQGKTIFTLDMAYNNARLITRPDSDWLMADRCITKK